MTKQITVTELERMTQQLPLSQRSLVEQTIKQNQIFQNNLARYQKNLNLLADYLAQPPVAADLVFDVLSDVHTDGADLSLPENQRFVSALLDLPFLNPTSRALVIPGDFSSRGSADEYTAFFDYIKTYNRLANVIVALGNHDVRWQDDPQIYQTRYLQANRQYMGIPVDSTQLYWDKWIANYHFIILNTEQDMKDNAYFSQAQLAWLRGKLADHNQINRPVFVIIHQAFKGTSDHIKLDRIYDIGQFAQDDPNRNFNHEEQLKKILSDYPNAVIFTGHVHNGRNLLRVYHEKYGHVVDLPSFVRADYGDKGCCDGYQVTVRGNQINLKLRNFKENKWIPQNEINFTI